MKTEYLAPWLSSDAAGELVPSFANTPPRNVLVPAECWPYGPSPFKAVEGPHGWAYAIRHDLDTIDRSVILHPDVELSCRRLDGWALRTGAPWVGTPGTSGQAVLRAMVARGNPPEPTWTIDPSCGSQSAEWDQHDELEQTPRDWSAAPGPAARWLHEYDANAAYLAAAGRVEVARWRLHSRTPANCRAFGSEELRPGLYLVDVDPWNDPRMPHPAGPAAVKKSGPIVLTHVTLNLLDSLQKRGVYGGYHIITGHVCDKKTRMFRQWSETLRDMMYAPEKDDVTVACAKASKAAYREAIGLMGKKGGRIYRPDWRAAIVAEARATLWRRAWQILNDTGRAPVSINVDAITYASDSGDPLTAAPQHLPMAANRLGGFKVKRSQLLGGEE